MSYINTFIFGKFSVEEFKKFLRMGAVFSFIIGTYWTIRVLKNSVFCGLVGAAQLPYAKTASIIFLVPVVLLYTKLLDRYSRRTVFYMISGFYATGALIFALALAYTPDISTCLLAGTSVEGWYPFRAMTVGYLFYLFVESYGSLLPALFWAIAADTTSPDSAKKGFSMVVALGQIGGIVGPFLLNSLPSYLGFTTSALTMIICGAAIFLSIKLMNNLFDKTPQELLVSYHGKNEVEEEKEQEPGFTEGLQLLFRHKYLLCMFAVIAFPDIITTIFDQHFNSLASQQYTTIPALGQFLGLYGSPVNFIALTFLLLGIGNITRLLGIGVALVLMPIIYGSAIFGFITLNSLYFLFGLMASTKAINYALNGPAIKQLYIPTTHDVRFKAQAWMETFGSRIAKEVGAVGNMPLGPLQKSLGVVAGRARHALFASYAFFGVVFVWIFVALFLGKKYKQAIDEKKVVC